MFSNGMKPIELFQFLRSSNDPQQFILNIMQEQSKGNPLMQNLLQMAQNNQTQDIESVVRNVMKERGVDFDKEFNSFKQQWGFK